MSDRPAVDVVIPFAGSPRHAADMLASLEPLRAALKPGDRLLLADNSVGQVLGSAAGEGFERVPALGRRSSYHARNVATAAGENPWILYTDSDCAPEPDILDAYLLPEPAVEVGLLAGAVRSVTTEGSESLVAAYASSREHIAETHHLRSGPRPAGVTANLMVRRAAWDAVGGFEESVRSGGDLDFCWRAQAAGWSLEHRPGAGVIHRHPDTAAAMLAKARRHAAGRRWINQRHPGALPRPRVLRPFVRGPLVAGYWLARGDRRRAAFKLLDMRWSAAMLRGYWRGDNAALSFPATPGDPSR